MTSKLSFLSGNKKYGVVFLALVLLSGWFTYAIFNKTFSSYDEVTLESSKTGLSLPSRADVKIRGVIVGEVLEVSTDGDGAELVLGLYPDQTETIPANVTAQILPKTLFGEKYVALQVPATPEGAIKAGDTIQRSAVAIEIEAVLNDLFPLLRTVQPADLNYTLTALANALEGRGDTLGEGIVTLDSYLKRLNPKVPELVDSLVKLGQVSAVYDGVVPDLARLLRNTVKTGNTLEGREEQLKALFNNVAGLSDTAEAFLQQNGDNVIRLADQGSRILPLLARYSPEYRCFLNAAANAIPRVDGAFRDKILHIILETVPAQPRGYTAADRPVNGDKRGPFPYCNLLDKAVNGLYSQNNLPPRFLVPDFNDGIDEPIAKRAAPVTDAVRGTAAEQTVIDVVAAPVLGVPLGEVPDLATLLLGPLARGMQVDVR